VEARLVIAGVEAVRQGPTDAEKDAPCHNGYAERREAATIPSGLVRVLHRASRPRAHLKEEDVTVKRLGLVVFSAFLLVALLPGTASATVLGSLDQSNDPASSNPPGIGTPGQIAQTFTAGKTGYLTEIQLFLVGSGTITASIEPTSGGLPTGVVLASSSESWDGIGWVEFPFAAPASVISGTKYAIVFNTGANGSTEGSGDTYSGGQALLLAGTWMSMQDAFPSSVLFDFAFKTYVDVPVVAPAQTALPQTAPPTNTDSPPSSNETGSPAWLLPAGLLGLLGVALVLVYRHRRLTR
jgi:hypothetical protein